MKIVNDTMGFPTLDISVDVPEKNLFRGMLKGNRAVHKTKSFREKKSEDEVIALKKAKSHWKKYGINRDMFK